LATLGGESIRLGSLLGKREKLGWRIVKAEGRSCSRAQGKGVSIKSKRSGSEFYLKKGEREAFRLSLAESEGGLQKKTWEARSLTTERPRSRRNQEKKKRLKARAAKTLRKGRGNRRSRP